jgi:hypothetical protein
MLTVNVKTRPSINLIIATDWSMGGCLKWRLMYSRSEGYTVSLLNLGNHLPVHTPDRFGSALKRRVFVASSAFSGVYSYGNKLIFGGFFGLGWPLVVIVQDKGAICWKFEFKTGYSLRELLQRAPSTPTTAGWKRCYAFNMLFYVSVFCNTKDNKIQKVDSTYDVSAHVCPGNGGGDPLWESPYKVPAYVVLF